MVNDKSRPGTSQGDHPQPNIPETTGKYQIKKVVGQGAMGMVYQGFDPSIERVVAIKVINKHKVAGQGWAQQQARFKREAQAAGRLQHPNIVTVHEYGEDHGAPFIVMEYVEGASLADLLRQQKRLALNEAVEIMRQLLDALNYSHNKGVVHRDIKPANVFILENRGVKLSDFGVAKLEASELTMPGMILGTPVYMSPEQLKGQEVDLRSDLFSAGIVFYEMVTGERPFKGDRLLTLINNILNGEYIDPCDLNPQLPETFKRVIIKSLSKNPQDRYQSAKQFEQAIQEALQRAPTLILPASALRSGRKPIHSIALAVLLVGFMFGTGVWLWISSEKKHEAEITVTPTERVVVFNSDKQPTDKMIAVSPAENSVTIAEPVENALYVKTVPPNVEVFINGLYVGITPLKYNIKPGKHQIALKKKGYVALQDEIIVEEDAENQLEYNAVLFRGFE